MKRIRRLALIGVNSHYIRRIVKGILAYCQIHGQWEFHAEPDSSPAAVRRTRQTIRQWKADGIIADTQSPEMERVIKDSGLPAINLNSSWHIELPTVIPDSFAIGRMGARYFLDNHFQNLAFCARTTELYAEQRCDGFVREVAKAGLMCDVFVEQVGRPQGSNWVKSHREISHWLLSLKKPVAVMCVHDFLAHELAGMCRHQGLRIPEDVAILGMGNEESLCLMCNPPLSSIDPGLQRNGYKAAQLLDRMLHGAKPPSKPILVPPRRVVVRQSSDVIAIEDAEVIAAVRFIREHAHEPVTVKDLLEEVPMCRRSLEYRFVRILGRTPNAELMRVRLQCSQDLLKHTNLPVKGVVKRSGYISERVFRSFFRRQTGMTPMQYRTKYQMVEPVTTNDQDG